jgi:hypothetical protein
VLDAIWLQTRAAEAWRCDEEATRDPSPYHIDDVIYHVVGVLHSRADGWENKRIQAYVGRNHTLD